MAKPRIRVTTGGTWTGHTAYQLRNMLRGASFNEIGSMLTKGTVSEAEVKRFYRDEVKAANRRIQAAEKAGVGFGDRPSFRNLSNMVTTSDLVHELADVNRFMRGKTTVTERVRTMNKQLDTMHGRGLFQNVNRGNFGQFVKFMDWIKAQGILKAYSSESDAVETAVDIVVETGADSSADFEAIWDEVLEMGV